MKFNSGDRVYWKRRDGSLAGDSKGEPKIFVVLDPKRKYCILRSLDFYEGGYSYQDLRIDMAVLVPVHKANDQEDETI